MAATLAPDFLKRGLFRLSVALHLRHEPRPVSVPVLAPKPAKEDDDEGTPEEVLEGAFLMNLRPGFVHVARRVRDPEPVGHLVVLARYAAGGSWSARSMCDPAPHVRAGRSGQPTGNGLWKPLPVTRLNGLRACLACLSHGSECPECGGRPCSHFAFVALAEREGENEAAPVPK